MISLHPLAAVPLAQAAADLAGWERRIVLLADLATVVIALALIAIAVTLAAGAWKSRRLYRKATRLLDRLEGDVAPIVRHATDVADNVNYVTTAIRADVEQLQGALAGVQARLGRATAATAQRIQRFNALLDVVQEEAEALFVDTAATLRGVKAGVRSLRTEDEEAEWSGLRDAEEEVADRPSRFHPYP